MTPEEKTKIITLKNAGLGYQAIAQTLDLKENTVKSFCHRNGLGEISNKTLENNFPGVVKKTCKQCGSLFIQFLGHREKVFCCNTCRIKWWNTHLSQAKRKTMSEYTCPV